MSDSIKMGQDAKRLLEDETFKQALMDTEMEFFRQWKDSDTVEEREQCHAAMTALHEVYRQMIRYMNAAEIERKRK